MAMMSFAFVDDGTRRMVACAIGRHGQLATTDEVKDWLTVATSPGGWRQYRSCPRCQRPENLQCPECDAVPALVLTEKGEKFAACKWHPNATLEAKED